MNVFVPIDIESSISKTEEEKKKDGRWFVRGFASTPDRDFQGEIVQPQGIDINYFVKSGWANYEHFQEAEYVVGAPTDNCYIDVDKGMFIEVVLFKDNKYAQSMWNLAKSIAKSGLQRNLGFSVEGYVVKRADVDKTIIEKMVVRNVALTKNPANPQATWDSFVEKAYTTGHEVNPDKMEDGSALRRESLAQAITTITTNINDLDEEAQGKLWKDVAEYLDNSDKTSKDNGVLLLQLSKGVSKEEAKEFLNNK